MISLCDRGCQARERDHGGALPRVHVPQEIMRTCVRWYVAYPLRTPHVEARMRERGVPIDHATVNRWVVTYRPPREEALPRRKQPVWLSWRMEETSLQGTGEWRDRDRAVEALPKKSVLD
jgi:putative transposase